MKKAVPLLEVTVVVGLFFFLRTVLGDSAIADWQQSIFGAAPVSSSLLYFVLPLVFVLAMRRNLGASGLATQRLGYHLRVAIRAIAVVAPVTILFPLVVLLGSDPKQWLGASILTIGFAAGGLVMARSVSGLANESETTINVNGFLGYIGLLVAGLALVALLNSVSQLLARIVLALVFVAFLEEVFFRGYIQSRLNESFGKPYSFHGVSFGAGLLIAAAIFGLMHPLAAPDETTPWAWAVWTATGGLIFGFLREKTGAVVTPAIVHGVILLPGVLFGAVGK